MEENNILARAEELGHAAGVRLAQERAAVIGDPHKARDIIEGVWWGQEPWPSSHGLVSVPGDYADPDCFATVHELGLINDGQLATLRQAEAQRQAATATINAIMDDGTPSPGRAFQTFVHGWECAFHEVVQALAYAVFGGEAAFVEMNYREEAAQIAAEKGLDGAAAEAFIAQHVADLKAEGERATPPSDRVAAAERERVRAEWQRVAASVDAPPPGMAKAGVSQAVWDGLSLDSRAALLEIHAGLTG